MDWPCLSAEELDELETRIEARLRLASAAEYASSFTVSVKDLARRATEADSTDSTKGKDCHNEQTILGSLYS